MSNEVAIRQTQTAVANWETPDTVAKRINRMLQIQREVMKPEADYGIIPGTQKPTLYKPGAELLCVTFGIADDMAIGYPERIEEEGHIRYIVKLDFKDRTTGIFIGHGIGECSTAEDKYAWRRCICDEEWEDTDADKRRIKYAKSGNSVYKNKQIRTNAADLANTVLKMAKKRAKIDGTLNCLAASRIFAQDLEDLPEGLDGYDNPAAQTSKPRVRETVPTNQQSVPPQPPAGRKITENQGKRLFALCSKHNVNPDHVKAFLVTKYGIESSKDMTKDIYERICDTIQAQPEWFLRFSGLPSEEEIASPPPPPEFEPQVVEAPTGDDRMVEVRRIGERMGCGDDVALLNALATEFPIQLLTEIEDLSQKDYARMTAWMLGKIEEQQA